MSRDTGKEREQKGGTGPCPGASSTELMELNTGGGAVRLSTPPRPAAWAFRTHTSPPHTPLQPGVQDRRARARAHTLTHTHTPTHPPSRLLGSLSHSGQDSHSVTPQSLSQPPPEQRPAGPKTAGRGGRGEGQRRSASGALAAGGGAEPTADFKAHSPVPLQDKKLLRSLACPPSRHLCASAVPAPSQDAHPKPCSVRVF